MFCVYLNALSLRYAGCPENGLRAIDWRRERCLQERPTWHAVEYDRNSFVCEELVRLCADFADEEADLVCESRVLYLPPALIEALPRRAWGYNEAWDNFTTEEKGALRELVRAWAVVTRAEAGTDGPTTRDELRLGAATGDTVAEAVLHDFEEENDLLPPA